MSKQEEIRLKVIIALAQWLGRYTSRVERGVGQEAEEAIDEIMDAVEPLIKEEK